MNAVVRGPAVDENTYGKANGAGECKTEWEAMFRLRFALGLLLADDLVRHDAQACHADDHTHTYTNVGKSDGARGELVLAFKNECDGREEEIEDTVVDGNVERHKTHDGGKEEHLHGSNDSTDEDLLGREVLSEFGAKLVFSSFFSELCCFAFEQDGVVRLTPDDEEDDTKCTTEDGQDPEHPAPGHAFDEETTAYGADDWAEKGTDGPDRHGTGSLLGREHVRLS